MTRLLIAVCLAAALAGCDRNIEPFVEGEQPRQPDLSAIFPEGAERAATPMGDVQLPEVPRRGGRGADPSSEAPPIQRIFDGVPVP